MIIIIIIMYYYQYRRMEGPKEHNRDDFQSLLLLNLII